jgi:cyclohexa-1,5-dienecarbonyl-CoA hydratase
MQNTPLISESHFGGQVLELRLNRPKANILDAEMTEALIAALQEAKGNHDLKAILLEGEGKHFSFGASVEEHLPGKYQAMILGFHRIFRTMLELGVPTLAALRGQCLGGGLELAMFCTRIFAAPSAKMGQPEVQLAVLPPIAAFFLAERVGRPTAEELCLSGRIIGAEDALQLGLVDHVSDDPHKAALIWIEEALLPHSAAALRQTNFALRMELQERFERTIPRIEELYFDELMQTKDAVEGLTSFLEKRTAKWSNQ